MVDKEAAQPNVSTPEVTVVLNVIVLPSGVIPSDWSSSPVKTVITASVRLTSANGETGASTTKGTEFPVKVQVAVLATFQAVVYPVTWTNKYGREV